MLLQNYITTTLHIPSLQAAKDRALEPPSCHGADRKGHEGGPKGDGGGRATKLERR